jgi:choline dehydrogenase-like flavoprotein
MNSAYDVIIIGTGAGGGTLASRLAPSGKRILLLERGSWLPREPQNWDAAEVCVRNRYVSPDTWIGPDGQQFQPQSHYFVGGATKVYGAALFRLREEDFGELRHHDGVSPAWPLTYDEMEPYYTQAERLYGVHGARGEDPTEPWASGPYPFPPVSHEPRIQQLADELAARGHHPFHAPCAIMLHEAEMAFSACVRCPTCDGFPCLVQAKSDADVVAVRPALEYRNVTLLTHARAVRLETNPAGTAVTDVVVEHDNQLERYAGDLVVVSCGAANSAKLLLQSASDRHPSGLANGSDEVGRNFMVQIGQAVLALSREPNPTVFQRTLAINDFYLGGAGTGFAGTGFAHPMGSIHLMGRSQAAMYRGDTALEAALARTWALKDVASHAVDFWLSTEDLPRSHNRVTLDRTGAIRLRYTPTNLAAGRRLYAQLKSMLDDLGMHPEHLIHRDAYLKSDKPLARVAHQAGTCRFGTDPATSVLDLNCRTHELDNLYVVDTSFFPSIGAVNPALTAMANALRVGDHLLARLGVRTPEAFADDYPNGSATASSSAASCGVGAVPPRWAGSHQRSSGPEGLSG